MAHAAGLPVYDKPDSTGICFIGERPFQDFLRRHLHTDPGPIETAEGRILGEHRGLALFTLGQRSGLGIGGRSDSSAAPWYVADKILERNALIIVQDPRHPLLLSDAFEVAELHWLSTQEASDRPLECAVKTRYRQSDLPCTVHVIDATRRRVVLRAPARAVTPGQYAVFYRGARCLGGGVITQRFNSFAAPEARGITYNCSFSVEGS